jgi:antitoxin VapB
MAFARIFKSGNHQVVLLPKEFRLKGPQVEVFRRGEELILREKPAGMTSILDALAELPKDMFPKKRKDPRPQRRLTKKT